MQIEYDLDDIFKKVQYTDALYKAIQDGGEIFMANHPNIVTLTIRLSKKPLAADFNHDNRQRLYFKDETALIKLDYFYMPKPSEIYAEILLCFRHE